jgi:hypothetical protein
MTDTELQQKRLAAAAIDVGVLIGVNVVLSLGISVATCLPSKFLATYGTQVVVILALLADIALVLGRDLTGGDGRSLGKKLVQIRVVRVGGGAISLRESIRRNMLFAPGLVLALIPACLELIPVIGALMGCLSALVLLLPRFLAAIGTIVVVVWEIVLIIHEAAGVRLGDKMAETRVTW